MITDRFTIASLAEGRTALVEITPVPGSTAAALATLLHEGSGGIGIAIENFATFPETAEFRAHEFYKNNFTSHEIDYCLAQPSVMGSFGKLWAVKEAVVKSGAAKAPPDGLAAVEISHDETGKPLFPGCLVSVSHADTYVVAVSFWPGALAAAGTARTDTATMVAAMPATMPRTLATRLIAFLGLLTMLFVFGSGLWVILNQLFRFH
jgi:phosphopantetheine--protein transferase-like protein